MGYPSVSHQWDTPPDGTFEREPPEVHAGVKMLICNSSASKQGICHQAIVFLTAVGSW
ncbi:hypothetical protein AVEN_173475-1, partial [Araneus ventricosus]